MTNAVRRILAALVPRSLQAQMMCAVSAVVLFTIVVSGVIVFRVVEGTLEEQIGVRALQIAQTVALVPEVRQAVVTGDPERNIQELAESMRQRTGAEFIVVADGTARRLSHPVPERIGQEFVGGDVDWRALRDGESYVSKAVGTLGPSLRGFAPVFDQEGTLAGFVAVGYLIGDVEKAIYAHERKPMLLVATVLLAGLFGAALIARHLKRKILGLEPAEIASLFVERDAILESIRAGIVAIDTDRKVRVANRTALRYLGLDPEQPVIGRALEEILPGTEMERVLETGVEEEDLECIIRGREMILSLVPLRHRGQVRGVVGILRRRADVATLARQLAKVREYSELLRVQAHEHSNTLHTIAGLIQIEAYQEALELILKESSGSQNLMQFLAEAVPYPVVSAIIIGKYNRARELNIELDIDRASRFHGIPAWVNPERLVTVIGNLLDNAFDAVRKEPEEKRTVRLFLDDAAQVLLLEVEDAGEGIDPSMAERLFEKGASTKADKRGVGLFLVRQCLQDLGGDIEISTGSLGGALFRVTIPKSLS